MSATMDIAPMDIALLDAPLTNVSLKDVALKDLSSIDISPLDGARARNVAAAPVVTLRSAGSKPLRFCGELLAEGTSRWPGACYWHEIQLYSRAGGGLALGLRLRDSGGRDSGADRARLFDSLDDAASWLEEFDPASDLHAGFDVSDPHLNGTELALKAAALRDRAEQLRQGFRALVGELLYRIETEG